MNTACSKQLIEDGWQLEQPDNWLRQPDPWGSSAVARGVEIKLNSSFELQSGSFRLIRGKPSTLWGIPFDRPIIGCKGKNINTLRLWAAKSADYFDFQSFSRGDFVAAQTGDLAAESITRVLYPDDTTSLGRSLRLVQEYFLVVHARSRTSSDASTEITQIGTRCQKRSRSS